MKTLLPPSRVRISCAAFFAAAAALAASSNAFAFDPDLAAIEDQTVIERFPAGSIISREKADQALREVKAARAKIDELAAYSTRRCQENFLVNNCIDKVRKAKMRQDRKFLAIEREARKVVRDDDARKERERQAERDRKAAEPPERIEPAKGRPANAAQESAAKNRSARKNRVEEVNEREALAREKASEESVNRAAYEEKLKEREARVREREAKLKARAEERAKKNSAAGQSGTDK